MKLLDRHPEVLAHLPIPLAHRMTPLDCPLNPLAHLITSLDYLWNPLAHLIILLAYPLIPFSSSYDPFSLSL